MASADEKDSSIRVEDDIVFLLPYDSYPELSGFECLQKVHKIAHPPVAYNSNSPLKMLFHLSGTGLEMVFWRPLFWIFLLFNIAINVIYHQRESSREANVDGYPKYGNWPKLGLMTVSIPGAVIAFMFVFYLNQTYAIYIDKWNQLINSCGAFYDFILMLRVHVADHLSPHARFTRHNLCKIANSIHILAYAHLPRNKRKGIDQWAWWFIRKNQLLTEAQIAELKSMVHVGDGNLVYRHGISWLQRSVWSLQDMNWFVPHVGTLISAKLFEFRTRLDLIYSHPSSPVPFAYYHLLNLVANIYLLILAYTMALLFPYWSSAGYFLVLLIFLGIREISDALSQPLGVDHLDIPVFYEVHNLMRQSLAVMSQNCAYPDEYSPITPPYKWNQESVPTSKEGLFLSIQ